MQTLQHKSIMCGFWPTNMATWCSWYSGWITDKAGSLQQGLEKGVEENIAPVKKLALQRDATASYAMRICEDYSMFGDWNDITVHIPHGLTCLARLIDEAGIVPGVWYVPCWVSLKLTRTSRSSRMDGKRLERHRGSTLT